MKSKDVKDALIRQMALTEKSHDSIITEEEKAEWLKIEKDIDKYRTPSLRLSAASDEDLKRWLALARTNERRCDLIDKEIDQTLTKSEESELKELQEQLRQYMRDYFPLPIEEAKEVLAKISKKED